MKLYGSLLCPDCPPAIELLDSKNVDFEFINITDSIPNLKEFLSLRDNREEFIPIKEGGYVGIPCLLTDNDEILFQDEISEKYR